MNKIEFTKDVLMVYNIYREKKQSTNQNQRQMKEGDAVWFTTVWSDAMNDHGYLLGEAIIQKHHYRVLFRDTKIYIVDEKNEEVTDPDMILEICRIVYKGLI